MSRTVPSGSRCVAVAGRRETVEAGLKVMSAGGNAVDAAVAMGFTAAVVEPTEASIGGSGFMLVHDSASGNAWSIEFPPRAPRRVPAAPIATGPLAPCVPGAVAGLCLAHDRFGTLPLGRLLEPAIASAEGGFEVDSYLTLRVLENLRALRACPDARQVFLRDGEPPVARFALPGTAEALLLRQPALGRTLRHIAAEGPAWFYRGPGAQAIASALAARGGLISPADLAGYEAGIEEPLAGRYRDWSVRVPRAPAGGWTVLQALQILDRLPAGERASAGALHLVAEALQLAFADRYLLAGDVAGARELLLDAERADELAARVAPDRASHPFIRAAAATGAGHGTTHLCAIDGEGRSATCTLTLGEAFGAKLVAGDTGVLLDSGMAWFDARPGRPNSIAPGKRPLVNMSPMLLLDGAGTRVGLGAAGGRRIISAVVQVAGAIVDHGLTLQDAIAEPRVDASEAVVRVSDRLAEQAGQLGRLGHEVSVVPEQHQPFSYELARPAAAGVDRAGTRSGGIHQLAPGFVGALD